MVLQNDRKTLSFDHLSELEHGACRVSGTEHHSSDASPQASRRDFLEDGSKITMLSGLVLGYGTFGYIAGRYLYPKDTSEKPWQYVARIEDFSPGESRTFESPEGVKVVITRRENTHESGEFFALSGICPHLGCQVHWQGNEKRFFCPCHNGAFDLEGNPTLGPPQKANQSLPRYPLKVVRNLLFIQV